MLYFEDTFTILKNKKVVSGGVVNDIIRVHDIEVVKKRRIIPLISSYTTKWRTLFQSSMMFQISY